MIQSYIAIMILSMNLVFIMLTHPLASGLILLAQTLLICLFSGLLLNNFWFSYILFLVFLGGLLILFIYVVSVASNDMFSSSLKNFFLLGTLIFMLSLMIYMSDKFVYNYLITKLEATSVNYFNMMEEMSMPLMNLYNPPINFMNIMLMVYLFITLIVVVKITNFYRGPLRKMN